MNGARWILAAGKMALLESPEDALEGTTASAITVLADHKAMTLKE